MKSSFLLAGFLFALPLSAADTLLVRDTEALSPAEEKARLHVPAGFEVQLFAAEPMINKPINMAFDERGRLWVSSTVEYPFSADKERWIDDKGTRVRDSRDAIKILEDTDGDGKADKVIDFADGLNIPTGVLPWHRPGHKAGCIAWSIPNIWYFGDTDGDDRADVREVLFGPLGYEKDTHGMCSSYRLGPDGWVYATHGFNNTSHFEVKDGSRLSLNSGNVFRFRPDASRIEIWSWGQVNPFGLTFDSRGNLYSADCHSAPIYQLLQGAYYPSFGKPHDGLGFAPVMCEHSHGSTGICGLVYIDGGIWGPEWDNHTLVGNVVTSRVNHDYVTFTGTTPRANEQPDFLVSDDPWFRPVDLQLGPDGALYIADFYNKIIGHYEVPLKHPGRDKERGRIWRITKKDAPAKKTRTISAPRFDPKTSVQELNVGLADESPFVQRAAAAEWTQRRDSNEGLAPLLNLLAGTNNGDAALRHVTRMAIREQLKQGGGFQKLSAWMKNKADITAELVQDLLVIALATPTEDGAAFALGSLKTSKPDRSTGLTIYAHVARYGTQEVQKQAMDFAKSREGDAAAQVAVVEAFHNGFAERGVTASNELLSWARELAERLLQKEPADDDVVWQIVPSTTDSPWTLQQRMCADGINATVISSLRTDVANAEQRVGTLRSRIFKAPAKLSFWICGHQGFPTVPANSKSFVRLIDNESKSVLQQAFPPRNDVCQKVEWNLGSHAGTDVYLEIVDTDSGNAFAWLGVTRIEPAILDVTAFDHDKGRDHSLRILATLLQYSAPAALREKLAPYIPVRASTPVTIQVSAEDRKRLEELIAHRLAAFARAKPNVERGQTIFAGNCSACHQIGGQGGLIGPQLDGIGHRGAARLCEDILDPNRNVDSHFYLHKLTFRDGSEVTGFIKGESGQVIIVADAAGKEQRISKGDLTNDATMSVSLMPPVFGQIIPETDFFDLLAWLLRH